MRVLATPYEGGRSPEVVTSGGKSRRRPPPLTARRASASSAQRLPAVRITAARRPPSLPASFLAGAPLSLVPAGSQVLHSRLHRPRRRQVLTAVPGSCPALTALIVSSSHSSRPAGQRHLAPLPVRISRRRVLAPPAPTVRTRTPLLLHAGAHRPHSHSSLLLHVTRSRIHCHRLAPLTPRTTLPRSCTAICVPHRLAPASHRHLCAVHVVMPRTAGVPTPLLRAQHAPTSQCYCTTRSHAPRITACRRRPELLCHPTPPRRRPALDSTPKGRPQVCSST